MAKFIGYTCRHRADSVSASIGFPDTFCAAVRSAHALFPDLDYAGVRMDGETDFDRSPMKRTQFELILADIQSGDVVAIYGIERFARDADELLKLCRRFQQAGVLVHLIDLGITIGVPSGDHVLRIIERVASIPDRRMAIDKARGKS